MKKSFLNLKNLLPLVMIFAVFACLNLQISAQSDSNSDSRLVTVKQSVLNDCAKTLDELEAQDALVESQSAEIKLLQDRLQLEKDRFDLQRQIADSAKREAEALTEANKALREAIAAQDRVIENNQKQIEILKNKKPSLMKRILDVAAGVGIGLILK